MCIRPPPGTEVQATGLTPEAPEPYQPSLPTGIIPTDLRRHRLPSVSSRCWESRGRARRFAPEQGDGSSASLGAPTLGAPVRGGSPAAGPANRLTHV